MAVFAFQEFQSAVFDISFGEELMQVHMCSG